MLSLSGGIDYGRYSAGNSLCGDKINKVMISKMSILDKAAIAKSYSNASSSKMGSGKYESAGKCDSHISESSISDGYRNYAHIS